MISKYDYFDEDYFGKSKYNYFDEYYFGKLKPVDNLEQGRKDTQ